MDTGVLNQRTAYEHKLPRTLHKRLKKKTNDTVDDDKGSSVINLPFASSKQQTTTQHDFSDFRSLDKPPNRSLFDPHLDQFTIRGEDSETIVGQMIAKPQSFNNAFTKDRRIVQNSNDISRDQYLDVPWTSNDSIKKSIDKSSQSMQNLSSSTSTTSKEFSVLVYGFTNNNFNIIMKHFAKYGRILEDFSSITRYKMINKDNQRSYPIFMGPSWVKITYDNPQSAIRALAEDGNEEENHGTRIGVIPYRADIVRQLLISPPEDSINIITGQLHKPNLQGHEIPDQSQGQGQGQAQTQDTTTIEGLEIGEGLRGLDNGLDASSQNTNNTKRLKDGSSLLVKTQKTGWLNSGIQIDKWLFGTGEI